MSAPDRSGATNPKGSPLVLVVEDDKGVRDLLDAVLSEEGFEVHTARDGLEGLLKVRMLEPAALILDIMMPDIGGLRVLDQLAAEHAATPVIVVTGATEAADVARERIGNDNVFAKPFDIDLLVDRVRALASGPGDAP